MKADSGVQKQMLWMSCRFIRAYNDKDMDGILNLFASDPDVVFYGNGKDEKSIGISGIREQAQHDWGQDASISLEVCNGVRCLRLG